MQHRLISSVVLIPLTLWALLKLSLTSFIMLVFLISLFAAWEWGVLSGFVNMKQRIAWVIGVGSLLLIMLWMATPINHALNRQIWLCTLLCGAIVWWIVAFYFVVHYPVCAQGWSHSCCWRALFGLSTIIPFFWGIISLRLHTSSLHYFPKGGWVLYLLILVWSADIGAYLFGRTMGKRRLIPSVSPGKTWEGALGGLVTALFMASLYKQFVLLTFDVYYFFLCSLSIIFSSIVGDLTESMLKRIAGLKESGHLIPGHGGILDRIDGLMAASPVCALWLFFISNVSG